MTIYASCVPLRVLEGPHANRHFRVYALHSDALIDDNIIDHAKQRLALHLGIEPDILHAYAYLYPAPHQREQQLLRQADRKLGTTIISELVWSSRPDDPQEEDQPLMATERQEMTPDAWNRLQAALRDWQERTGQRQKPDSA